MYEFQALEASTSGSKDDAFYTHTLSSEEQSAAQRKPQSIKREPLVFFIMRLNLRAVLLLLIVSVAVITFCIYMRCDAFSFSPEFVRQLGRRQTSETGLLHATQSLAAPLQDIECSINQEYSIHCKRDENANEVYVPFSFLRQYFDVSGAVSSSGGGAGIESPKFNWMHSTAKVNLPKGKYDTRGVFMYFENYNVEVRDRVKCISAAEGVPVSTQWEKRGYFYPTQIAQFALAHYSKNLTEPAPRVHVLEDADSNQLEWSTPKTSNMSRIWHHKFNTSIVQFETTIGYESAISIQLNQTLDLVLSVDLLLVTNSSSLMVTVLNRDNKHRYNLHYIAAELLLSVQESNIYYGLGTGALNKWRHMTRDLHIDVQKGIVMGDKRSPLKVRRSDLEVLSIAFLGIGFYDNLTLSTSNHLAHFYDAAEWFVHNQDHKSGGWTNPVRRSLNGFAELRPGWISAMGQGHAISVLARAYWHSGGDERYLRAAALGLQPYRVYSRDGGVLAQFMDKYYWYEEYPTTPASYVLNGFIYSLLGLYDLNSTAPGKIAREAGKLFAQGMYSLKKMLLLYDTGSGTSYDLRHLSLGVAPNLARWDYHATHVNQLLLLATIDSDPLILQTAERWKGYMFGKRAKHN
ncbi:Hsepi [Drosophila busckii]|uniref:heparosan-N-sulfate-glucuronate 5-epimerase n=1 Tax=Drosophila busckii TaxID=30019 RepID=A0A0M4E6L7_DROBS|nr:D-glucuronyl C5-epimerase B [Drosophila busckii]XP_017839490.1 D-glucuronyl C5-epimerase B [Drosophila busckii]ALC42166.1 Hsepi [Drosophila busckii]